jgi:hypothetical protein
MRVTEGKPLVDKTLKEAMERSTFLFRLRYLLIYLFYLIHGTNASGWEKIRFSIYLVSKLIF